MKYLFYDLEYASSKGGISKICEFGYVLTDESFNVLERDNFIIDPYSSRDSASPTLGDLFGEILPKFLEDEDK